MKHILFENQFSKEQFVCEDLKQIKIIDGVTYLAVHRPHNDRMFFVRQDSLRKLGTVPLAHAS
jgi:hypothetical protein